ncbi:MAG: hypothetical protein ACT4N2_09850 [Hyphomicrobium sp.]
MDLLMTALDWLWWAVTGAIGVVWSLVWFLLGGWVSTLAQIGVIVLVIFGLKYGWRQAPFEVWSRLGSFGRFAWSWVRAKDPGSVPPRVEVREVVRTIRVKEAGDVNLSSLLNVLVMAGLLLVAAI